MRAPEREDGERCIQIRVRSKRGEQVAREDRAFCLQMFERYEEWYSLSEARVFNLSAPFGSDVRMDEDPKIYQYREG